MKTIYFCIMTKTGGSITPIQVSVTGNTEEVVNKIFDILANSYLDANLALCDTEEEANKIFNNWI